MLRIGGTVWVENVDRLVDAAGRPPLVVDFGLPSDADDVAALGVRHLDMAAINSIAEGSRSRRRADTAVVREHVDRALVDLRREAAERALAPIIQRLVGRYRQTAEQGAARLFQRRLSHLSEEERQDFARFDRFGWHADRFGWHAVTVRCRRGCVGPTIGSRGPIRPSNVL